jgi:hypothetical protein
MGHTLVRGCGGVDYVASMVKDDTRCDQYIKSRAKRFSEWVPEQLSPAITGYSGS